MTREEFEALALRYAAAVVVADKANQVFGVAKMALDAAAREASALETTYNDAARKFAQSLLRGAVPPSVNLVQRRAGDAFDAPPG